MHADHTSSGKYLNRARMKDLDSPLDLRSEHSIYSAKAIDVLCSLLHLVLATVLANLVLSTR